MGGPADDRLLDTLQRKAFGYFVDAANAVNGLIRDRARPDSPASIAATGFALTVYPIGVERGWLTRDAAIDRTLATLRFFADSDQSESKEATGHRGFYYHFLDMATGRRANRCELSTIDSAFLLAGCLAAAMYFDRSDAREQEIRTLADLLNARADWQWAQNGGLLVTHGWTPERGFLRYRWGGYNEALLLYVLALGSPTFPLPVESYAAWTASYRWKTLYGHTFLYAGPLFIHQLPHLWIDFRGIRDAPMREHGLDYFENSRRAVLVQQAYAIRNPRGFEGYGEEAWGLSASDGPGPATRMVGGIERRFHGYRARGVPFGPDDGTLSPSAMIASLPFAPELVFGAMQHFDSRIDRSASDCFVCSSNPTFDTGRSSGDGWVPAGPYGLEHGPIVAMIVNHRSGLPWRSMRGSPIWRAGLQRAGFTGGWLDAVASARSSPVACR